MPKYAYNSLHEDLEGIKKLKFDRKINIGFRKDVNYIVQYLPGSF